MRIRELLKEVDSMNYARWHGDKCKHKENK
jgi:hypothetical protein